MKYLCIALALLTPWTAHSARYRIGPASNGKTGIRFELPYSLGTHEGDATAVDGGLSMEGGNWATAKGHFQVPIASLVNGSKKLECHLQEALGLDYKKSEYPESHVCTGSDTLPTTGPNAVVYPEIRFEWKQSRSLSPEEIEVNGQWTIHGVSLPTRLALAVRPAENGKGFFLKGADTLRLADFGVEVKNFLFVSVGDSARAFFELQVRESP